MPPDDPEKGGASRPGMPAGAGGEIIFEFTPLGGSVKVTAVDVATGVEVSVVGPTTAPQRELERVARGKLLYRLKRIEEGEERAPEKPTPRNPEEGSGGGIIV